MTKPIRNLPASIMGRLRNLASSTGQPINELLYLYAMERFLARLAISPYSSKLILKGGLLFYAWQYPLRRPTRDIDLHAEIANSAANVLAVIRSICEQSAEADGIGFDISKARGDVINLQATVQGVRVRFQAQLGDTVIPVQIDVSFANVITPAEKTIPYPTLLSTTGPLLLRTYPQETAMAEKLEAVVKLGLVADRLQDFYDMYVLSVSAEFHGPTLSAAIRATFLNRATPLPTNTPPALADGFAQLQQTEWNRLLRKFGQAESDAASFQKVIARVRDFVLPPLFASAMNQPFDAHWQPERGWIA